MGPISAPAAPVVFVPVFVPIDVPTDVIQSVVQEEAAEAVVAEATALTITSAQSVAVAENTVTAFHTVIASPITVTIVSIWKEITTVKGKLYVFCFAFRMHGIEIFTQSGVSNVNAQPRIFIDRFND